MIRNPERASPADSMNQRADEACVDSADEIVALNQRTITSLSLWLSEASEQRLRAASFDISVDIAMFDKVEIALVSTRTPALRVRCVMNQLASAATPIVVICHAGGEHAAVEFMRQGASCIVAEGNESALR